MKILICESNFSAGGAERVVCNLANYLACDYEIKVLSLTKTDMAYKMDDKIKCECVDKKEYKKANNILVKICNKISKNVLRLFKLNKQIKSFNPDVILSFLPEPSFFTLFLKKKKIPVIISALISLINLLSSSAYKITSPISSLCSAISIVLTYFAVKFVFNKKDEEAIKTFVLVEVIYIVVAFILSFIGIYI